MGMQIGFHIESVKAIEASVTHQTTSLQELLHRNSHFNWLHIGPDSLIRL